MTLCDTGPLVALVDADDPHHPRCVETLTALPPEPLLTTWPCLTEALYLLGRGGGLRAQEELWGYLAEGLVVLDIPGEEEWQRLRELMNEYHDAPMDFADASLVAVAERLGLSRIFSLDRHFHAFRIHGEKPFEVVP